MSIRSNFLAATCFQLALIGSAPMGSGENRAPTLPVVLRMDIPRYPPLARVAAISGEVHLLVQTDGKKVINIIKTTGTPSLIASAKNYLNSWQFEEHEPTKFNVTFKFNCSRVSSSSPRVPDSIQMSLPTYLELTTTIRPLVDPVRSTSAP